MVIDSVEVGGKELPGEFMSGLRTQNMWEESYKNPETHAVLEKLESSVGEVSPVLVDEVIGAGLAQARLPSQAPEIDGVVFLEGAVQPGDLVDARITGVREFDLEAELT